mgnify:CR=1 FL=1
MMYPLASLPKYGNVFLVYRIWLFTVKKNMSALFANMDGLYVYIFQGSLTVQRRFGTA